MSTFNGERYINEQLNSVRTQEGMEIFVYARDDGSSDKTCSILHSYASEWPSLKVLSSEDNLGPGASFLRVLSLSPEDFDYYAFCDQDDIWLPSKLLWAHEKLSTIPDNIPALYCSLADCVDDEMTPLGQTEFLGSCDFEHTMFANIAAGNTLVMNRAAAGMVRSKTPDRGVIMHDWWCALVVSAFGSILPDPRSTLFYRQHQSNVQGVASGRIGGLLVQLRAFLKNPRSFYPIHAQMAEFLRLFGDQLPAPKRRIVEHLVQSRTSLGRRLLYAASARIPRWDLFGAIGTRVLIAADWY